MCDALPQNIQNHNLSICISMFDMFGAYPVGSVPIFDRAMTENAIDSNEDAASILGPDGFTLAAEETAVPWTFS